MDNVIQFYIELNDRMSSQLRTLKTDFESIVNDIQSIAETMVTGVESSFTKLNKAVTKSLSIDSAILTKSFNAAIKNLRASVTGMTPVKVPVNLDITGTAIGAALGTAIGTQLGKISVPDFEAKLTPRIGGFGPVKQKLADLRREVADWFKAEKQAIPLRFSEKLSNVSFPKGGLDRLRDKLAEKISKKLAITGIDVSNLNAALEDVADDFALNIDAVVGEALMSVSLNAADAFVERIRDGLEGFGGIGGPAGPAGPTGAGPFGGPFGLNIESGRKSKVLRELLQGAKPANVGTAMTELATDLSSEIQLTDEQKIKFLSTALGRTVDSADWITKGKWEAFKPKDVGEGAKLKRDLRTPDEGGVLGQITKYLMKPTVPELAAGGMTSSSLSGGLPSVLHANEMVLPYDKAEKSLAEIIKNLFKGGVIGALGAALSFKQVASISGVDPAGLGAVGTIAPAFARGVASDRQKIEYARAGDELNAALAERTRIEEDIMYSEHHIEAMRSELATLHYRADRSDYRQLSRHIKKNEDVLARELDAHEDAAAAVDRATKGYNQLYLTLFRYDRETQARIREIFGMGPAGQPQTAGAAQLPPGFTRTEIEPEAKVGALDIIASRAFAQQGQEAGGLMDYGEMFAVVQAAIASGDSALDVQQLLRISTSETGASFADLNHVLATYTTIMRKADLSTEAGVKTFHTARGAITNLGKRLRDSRKQVVGNTVDYSDFNLELTDMIDRTDNAASMADMLAKAHADSANSTNKMTASFAGLLREAKNLAPLMLTIAGAKVSARVDTSLIGTQQQLVNNQDAWVDYRDIATKVMAETRLKIEDVGKIMTVAARRGFESREEIEKFAMTVGHMAVTAKGMGADVESAVGTAAYTFKRLGIDVSDMDVAFSHMIKSSTAGALTLSELNSTISQNIEWMQLEGSTSAQATLRMARFAGALQAVSESFGTAQQGAAGVQDLMQMVVAMADPAQWSGPVAAQITTLLHYAGMSFDQLMGKIHSRDFAGVMLDLVRALKAVPTEQVEQFGSAIEGLIGVSHEAIMQLKVDPGVADRLQRTLASIDQAGMGANDLARGVDEYNKNLNESVDLLKGKFTRAVDESFGTVKNFLVYIVDKVNFILDSYQKLPTFVKGAVGSASLLVATGLLIKTIGTFVLTMKGVVLAMTAAARTFAAGSVAGGAAGGLGKGAVSGGLGGAAAAGGLKAGAAKLGVYAVLAAGAAAFWSMGKDLWKESKGEFRLDQSSMKKFAAFFGMDEIYKSFIDESEEKALRENRLVSYAKSNSEHLRRVALATGEMAKRGRDEIDEAKALTASTNSLLQQYLSGPRAADAPPGGHSIWVQTGPREGYRTTTGELPAGGLGMQGAIDRVIEQLMAAQVRDSMGVPRAVTRPEAIERIEGAMADRIAQFTEGIQGIEREDIAAMYAPEFLRQVIESLLERVNFGGSEYAMQASIITDEMQAALRGRAGPIESMYPHALPGITAAELDRRMRTPSAGGAFGGFDTGRGAVELAMQAEYERVRADATRMEITNRLYWDRALAIQHAQVAQLDRLNASLGEGEEFSDEVQGDVDRLRMSAGWLTRDLRAFQSIVDLLAGEGEGWQAEWRKITEHYLELAQDMRTLFPDVELTPETTEMMTRTAIERWAQDRAMAELPESWQAQMRTLRLVHPEGTTRRIRLQTQRLLDEFWNVLLDSAISEADQAQAYATLVNNLQALVGNPNELARVLENASRLPWLRDRVRAAQAAEGTESTEDEIHEQDRKSIQYNRKEDLRLVGEDYASDGLGGKNQIVVNADAPKTVAILTAILNLLNEEATLNRRKPKAESVNPFFRKMLLGG